MVPVELELKNFLSYGTDAPTLRFDEFQIACLSGKNGQGKSALLDAMTWAVWGEARKSSGKRKPDEELIRIGTRHMEVSFVFDVEGARYRVMRSFSRSASGKTTTSELEFQVYVPDADAYKPLTGGHQRETQQTIEATLGLDYDTFINSAFLLQGRSDEFTKKRPSERKEILASILNLSRYEALAKKARDRWREAKERQQQTASEIERLTAALEEAPAWRKEQAAVKEQAAAKQEQLDALRAEEKALTEQRATLEAKAQEAASVEESLDNLAARLQQHQNDAAELRTRIESAEALLDQREAIQQDYERYQALQEERDALDEKRDLHRGLEKQIEQKRSAMRDKKNELEKTLDRLDMQRKQHERDLETCVQKLAQRPAVREKRDAARAAQERLTTLTAVRQQAEALDAELAEVEQAIVGRREALRSQRRELRQQIEAKEKALQQREALEARIEQLEEKATRHEAQRARLDTIQEKGRALAEAISARVAERDARQQERDKQQAELARLRAAEDGACPTCGSVLTASHRQEVIAAYEETIDALQAELDATAAWLEEKEAEREALRATYRSVQKEIDALAEVPEQLATAREQRRVLDNEQAALDDLREQGASVQQTLEEEQYAPAARKRRQALRQRRAACRVDEAELERVQNEAAQFDRYAERLRELEEYAGRKEQIEKKLEQNEQRAAALREQLDSGAAFRTLHTQIEQLQAQLEQVDFDPERFDAVRAALRELSEAGSRMNDLVNAQQNREDWKQQLARIEQRIEQAQEERQALQEKQEQLQDALGNKASLVERQEAKAEEVAEAEQALTELQQRLGELTAKLEQAADDQQALAAAKKRRKEAAADRALYKHLRRAFGKHGIPSLIIEETLPEIEERANLLLDRLTDGKMHVRLETLRDKKTGGTKETLEIIITDEQGVPRPYETFSGGESFRVNFALRIALAQLLAERSGVRIRTLVIDEGFGTQDEEGIERLVDAIQAIQEDFAKIIVITHLERLKQVFPVRIEVEKDPATGSSFQLLGA